jgi:hypothetical protein
MTHEVRHTQSRSRARSHHMLSLRLLLQTEEITFSQDAERRHAFVVKERSRDDGRRVVRQKSREGGRDSGFTRLARGSSHTKSLAGSKSSHAKFEAPSADGRDDRHPPAGDTRGRASRAVRDHFRRFVSEKAQSRQSIPRARWPAAHPCRPLSAASTRDLRTSCVP